MATKKSETPVKKSTGAAATAAKKTASVKEKAATAKAKAASEKSTAAKSAAAKKTASVKEKSATAKAKAAPEKSTAAKTAAAKTSAKAKKPVAGIDEDGTFRAWDNAKSKDVPKSKAKSGKTQDSPSKLTAEEIARNLEKARSFDPGKDASAKKPAAYDDEKIRHLDALEHIRLRSGMYIGRLGDGSNQNDGIYVLLKEVIDNSIDEFIMGFGNKIDISIKDNHVKVRDYGRGIPLGKVVECVSEINTGAKYDNDVFLFSVGMNGVGTKAVNALSSYFRVCSIRSGECCEAVFEKGKLIKNRTGKLKEKQPDGTFFEFVPDEEIFGKYSYNMEFVEKRIRNYAYLNTGLTLHLNGIEYSSKEGLLDLLQNELEEEGLYPVGSYRGEHLQFAFTHTNAYGENYFSFVNGQFTSDGGTHLAAFREGFIKGVNDFFQTSFKSEDIREGITAAILIKIKNPVFESQTKNKLGNTEIRQWVAGEVQSGLNDWLLKNPKAAERLKEKIAHNEKMRVELSNVKKLVRDNAKKNSIRIEKLDDCRYHLEDGEKGKNSMIFITEGQSASGVMTHSRNSDYQAIFSLRGKPENMYGKKQTDIWKNAELAQLMTALGIEDSVDNLRYSKIVIATDADNDGFHIRNLLLTFFLGYFEELITSGRVWILETPLFRVRNKKENIYCYTEEERDAAQKKLGKSCETSRFKGLGEMNSNEFKHFIAPETINLTPVEISQLKVIPQLLAFYMGKNTPERRKFIENNLLSNADIDV